MCLGVHYSALVGERCSHALSAGTVPGSLGDLQQLIVLDLSSNQVSGDLCDFAIQTSIGDNNLNSVLRFFSTANNSLSGEGPQACCTVCFLAQPAVCLSCVAYAACSHTDPIPEGLELIFRFKSQHMHNSAHARTERSHQLSLSLS